jgi:chorismate mutase/prephenate dehydrogenase
VSETLASLRRELDRADRQLLEIARERLRLVAAIREQKLAAGMPAFDRTRERQVMAAAERHGAALDLPPSLVRALVGALLEASHELQAEAPGEQAAMQRRLLVVGGRGKMGALFGGLLSARGHAVDVLERDDPIDPALVRTADVVLVAVPMSEAARVAALMAPLVRSDALLCDINSLKREVCEALSQSAGEALGTHPMFGPTVSSLRRQKVVVCRLKRGPMSDWLESELERMGAELVESDPDTHDRMMAVVQVLTHFGIMVMGLSLAESGMPLEDSLRFMSPIYRLEVSMVGRLFSQEPQLYREILMQNPHGEALRELFVSEARALADAIAGGERDDFVTRFQRTARFFSGFSSEAMALSDHIIETIMSRA